MMKSLVDIATSGASPSVVLELMAKQIEKRLQALEQGNHTQNTEKLLSTTIEALKGFKQQIEVAAPSVKVDSPVVNVTPSIQVVEREEKNTMKITVERGLSGAIESLTVIKG